MKDSLSPMDVCPFCGKAFKRLKSHLPHCKMAETKTMAPETDRRDKGMTADLAPMKIMDTALPVVEKQDPKVKGKKKTEGHKSQVRQEKTVSLPRTTQPKAEEAAAGNTLSQQKAAVTMGRSSAALHKTIRTSLMVTSRKDQEQVALTGLNAPVQQALILRPKVQRTLPANVESPRMRDTLQTLRDQVCTENVEDDRGRLSMQEQISEKDPVESPVKYHGVQDQFHEQIYSGQDSVSRSLSGSTGVSGMSSNFPLERVKTQIPGISPTACNTEASRTIEMPTEIKIDTQSPPKTALKELLQAVDCSLGLQWIPQLYSNYVQLGIVPGRQDQWDPYERGTKTLDPIGRLPELCKKAGKESVLENQSTSKHLMDVRLGEIPVWLANRSFAPKRFPELVQKAWGRYYNKYINVKKGGVGGLTMLLAGYCVLSYSWNYDHIKQDRWRKYH